MDKQAFLFGYGSQGRSLAKSLRTDQFRLHIIESDPVYYEKAKSDRFLDVVLVDVTNDAELEALHIDDDSYIVCVMEDEHLNVFLTLSLRSLYPHATIVAISDSVYTTQKLKMAGANRIIDVYKVSAYRIHNMLVRPVATKLLDSFISDGSTISFREMLIPEGSFLDGMMIEEVHFGSYGILLLGMLDIELSNKFIFITAGIDHKLDSGDTIVCMGYNEDLDNFIELIGRGEMP
jgi:voltage-gated potassium channel